MNLSVFFFFIFWRLSIDAIQHSVTLNFAQGREERKAGDQGEMSRGNISDELEKNDRELDFQANGVGGREDEQDDGHEVAALLKFRKPRTEGKRLTARGGHSGCVVNTDLIFFGGHCYGGKGKFEHYNDTCVLDLETNTWHKVKVGGRVPSPRYGHSAAVIGSRIYIFGGSGPDGHLCNDIFFLDTTTWCWVEVSATTEGPRPRFGHACTTVGNKIVISSGWDGKHCFDDFWIFDTASSAWIQPKTSGRPPCGRQGHTMELTFDGRIIVFGGMATTETGHPNYLNDVCSLDIETMVWTKPRIVGDYIDPRFLHTSCMLGKYFVSIGGFIKRKNPPKAPPCEGSGRRIKKPETGDIILALDTEALEWVRIEFFGNCPDELYGHSLAIAGDNQVVCYGGWGGNRALDELFVAEALGPLLSSIEFQMDEEEYRRK